MYTFFQPDMKHVLPLLVILLYHQYDVTLSSVINDGFPDEIADCRDVGTSKMYKCIRSKFDDPDWIPDSGPKLKLRLRQDFYWHPTRRIRRECRAIPREEWHALCDAINTLKKDKVPIFFANLTLLINEFLHYNGS